VKTTGEIVWQQKERVVLFCVEFDAAEYEANV
jgi:hypothetical protein